MKKTMYIRVDLNDQIATGHIMRCLSIADAAKRNGTDAVFILADEQAWDLIENRGFEAIILHTAWNRMDDEIPALSRIIQKRRIQKILVDSYMATERYLLSLSRLVEVFYIDDLRSVRAPLGGIINYSFDAEMQGYDCAFPDAIRCIGPSYAPLRTEFSHLPSKKIRPSIEHILILSGGTDPYGIIRGILNLLESREDTQIYAFCGMYHSEYEYLKKKYEERTHIHLHRSHPDIVKWMLNADIAISAAGTTIFELFAAGTPLITYTMADNQILGAKSCSEKGLAIYIGDVRNEDIFSKIPSAIRSYEDANVRKNLSLSMQAIVDGKGAGRIVNALL